MKNKLPDLNNHLFAQLERLTDEELSAEQIEAEVKRADAVVAVSDQIVAGMKLQLDAAKLVAMHGDRFIKQLPMLSNGGGEGAEGK
jgi:hypothetical protein